jgi:hypothetical protein
LRPLPPSVACSFAWAAAGSEGTTTIDLHPGQRSLLPAALSGTFSFLAHPGQVMSIGHFVGSSTRRTRDFLGSTGFSGYGRTVYRGQDGNARALVGQGREGSLVPLPGEAAPSFGVGGRVGIRRAGGESVRQFAEEQCDRGWHRRQHPRRVKIVGDPARGRILLVDVKETNGPMDNGRVEAVL